LRSFDDLLGDDATFGIPKGDREPHVDAVRCGRIARTGDVQIDDLDRPLGVEALRKTVPGLCPVDA